MVDFSSGSTTVGVASSSRYFICVNYRDWYIDEGFAIYKNADARGETPIREVLKHDFWGTPLDPPEGYTTHKLPLFSVARHS